MAEKIFIDTDCGIDDAVAIMLALASPEVEVTGISCVAGNTSLDNVVNNVCGLLAFMDRKDVPVYRGCSTSLIRIEHRAAHIHGENGLADVYLDSKGKKIEAENAAEGIYLAAKANPGLKLVTLGPMTNAAVAFNMYPELDELVSEIVVMGGAVGDGNVTPFAEFNFYFDPESVVFMLGTDVKKKILTWDATVDMRMPEDEFLALGMEGSPAGDFFNKIQLFYIDFIEKASGSRSVMFPDPLTVACLVDPSVALQTEEMPVRMALGREDKKRGASIKVSASDESDGNAEMILKCSRKRFKELIKRIK